MNQYENPIGPRRLSPFGNLMQFLGLLEKTPAPSGPWRDKEAIAKGEQPVGASIAGDDGGTLVAFISWDFDLHEWTPEVEANAKLIAAAPRMFDALEALDKLFCGFAEVVRTEDWGDFEEEAIPEAREAFTLAADVLKELRRG